MESVAAEGDRSGRAFPELPAGESVRCYPGVGKKKGLSICQAFAQGCGGKVQEPGTAEWLAQGAAFFYGVTPDLNHLYAQVVREGRDFYYCDNAYYFGRGKFFRVTRGAMQHNGCGTADPARWRAFGIPIQPWQRDGRHIVVASQSNLWHQRHHGVDRETWAKGVRDDLAEFTDRPVVLCLKPEPLPSPTAAHSPGLADALRGAWAMVVHSSSAAVAALIAGVPVFTLAQSAATFMGRRSLDGIEAPLYPADRERWLSVLAANQWSGDEMRSGKCWRDLNGG